MMMMHAYRSHGIFLSDRTLNKLLIIQGEGHGSVERILEEVWGTLAILGFLGG